MHVHLAHLICTGLFTMCVLNKISVYTFIHFVIQYTVELQSCTYCRSQDEFHEDVLSSNVSNFIVSIRL